jgi:hypothetical protein
MVWRCTVSPEPFLSARPTRHSRTDHDLTAMSICASTRWRAQIISRRPIFTLPTHPHYLLLSQKLHTMPVSKELLEQVKQLIPPLSGALHKGQSGRVGVLGGAMDYTGAPFFASMSSQRLVRLRCYLLFSTMLTPCSWSGRGARACYLFAHRSGCNQVIFRGPHRTPSPS